MTLSRRGFLAGTAAIVAAGPSTLRAITTIQVNGGPVVTLHAAPRVGETFVVRNPTGRSVFMDLFQYTERYGVGPRRMSPEPLVVPPGGHLALADYGALEARVAAWCSESGRLHRVDARPAARRWFVVSPDSVDDRIASTLARKREMMEAYCSTDARRLSEMIYRKPRPPSAARPSSYLIFDETHQKGTKT